MTLEPLEQRLALTALPAGFAETTLADGLIAPTSMAEAPDGRIFVTEQGGDLRVVKNGETLPTPFVSLNVDSAGERGLLGVALDPNFSANQFVYVYYTTATGAVHNRVSRFTASGDVAQPGSEVGLLELDSLSSATNHNGGALHFGIDGRLYIAVGENADGSNSQSLDNLLGKMLRINRDGSIPSDNPFFNTASGVNRAIWAIGLRNPFTFAVQPGTGRIFINDVGQSTWEEINDGLPGANYGWPATEGPTTNPNFTSPLFAYPNGGTDPNTTGCAIAGGAFYNPAVQQFPAEYVGDYFFADLCNRWIRRFDPETGAVTPFATETAAAIVDVDTSADGSLLYLSRAAGAILKIETPLEPPMLIASADAGGEPRVRVLLGATDFERLDFLAYGSSFRGGVRVATGDVNLDGMPDIITGAGPGGGPHVRVFDGQDGTPLAGPVGGFMAFDINSRTGIHVAAGDLTGDNRADLVISVDAGGDPMVRVFDGLDGSLLGEFLAYADTFEGGVRVAVGDVDGDGSNEIITAAGSGGGPHVRVFVDFEGTPLAGPLGGFYAYDPSFSGGVYIAAGDLDGDERADIVTGAGQSGGPHVRAFRGSDGSPFLGFYAYGQSFIGGVRVGVGDMNADGRPDIITGAGPGGGPHVRVFSGIDGSPLAGFFALASSFRGGVFVAGDGLADNSQDQEVSALLAAMPPDDSSSTGADTNHGGGASLLAQDLATDDLLSAAGLSGSLLGQSPRAKLKPTNAVDLVLESDDWQCPVCGRK